MDIEVMYAHILQQTSCSSQRRNSSDSDRSTTVPAKRSTWRKKMAALPFPSYLLPSTFSLPFRRRHSSTTSATSAASPPSLSSSPTETPSSSPPDTTYLPSFLTAHSSLTTALKSKPISQDRYPKLKRTAPNTLKCITCASDIAFSSQIVSKGFTGRHGRAYLVAPPPSTSSKSNELINTKIGRSVNRELLTGAHVVADVTCTICKTVLGWKYVDAKEPAQRYKIGKFIVEMKRVVIGVNLEEHGGPSVDLDNVIEGEQDVVVFDSEDEDECEDLFAGTWDRETVAKRRVRRGAWRNKEYI